MVSTAYWVLIVVTVMLLSEYDRHDLVLLLLIGVFVAGGGTLLVGGIDLRERRYAVRPAETAMPPWRYGLWQGIKLLAVVVLVKGVNGTLWDASVWMWCAAAVCLLGGSTLLLGAVERWRRTQWEKRRTMAIKFQYNKTSLGEMRKKLQMRQRALPTIKSKESALRLEVKKARDAAAGAQERMEALLGRYEYMSALWGEFDPGLLTVKGVDLRMSKIAGVNVPVLGAVDFEEKDYDLFSSPVWYADGIALLKEVAQAGIESEVYMRRMEVLDHARKKTTQKVNLYEKVQIPGYETAILKIRRFLEDEENLSKSAQKIVKSKHEQQEPEAV